MKRWAFPILAAVSFLLLALELVFWVRSFWIDEALHLTTDGGASWQLSSSGAVDLLHIDLWPEPAAIRYVSVNNRTHAVRPESLAIYFWSDQKHESQAFQVFVSSGLVAVMTQPNGRVLRGPPFPSGPSQFATSAPLRFWRIQFPHWMAALILALAPGALLVRIARQRLQPKE